MEAMPQHVEGVASKFLLMIETGMNREIEG
jgi:hypothetical protein